MIKTRNEIDPQDKWNVESLYPSLDAWEKEFAKVLPWTKIASFKGHLHESATLLKSALEAILDLERKLEKLYTYAHLRHDEDITDDLYKDAMMRISSLIYDFKEEISWFEPEILSLPDDTIKAYLNSKELAPYKFYLEKIVRLKPHTLSHEMEALLAMSGKPLQTSSKAFSSLNNADLKFPKVSDESGKEHELTHGLYQMYMRSQDRTLRANTFKGLHNTFLGFENTLAELINGQMQTHNFNAKARRFNSSLECALFNFNIPTSVYFSLIKTVRAHLPILHKYFAVRKKVLGVKELHLYDMSVPLVKAVDIRMEYPQAEIAVIDSVAPLGKEYQQQLKTGMQQKRWVDRYENKNKRSGAYSSGCYDSSPYILMNYRGVLRDVFTLAHEAGHSMHSFLSNQTQDYPYASYPIFCAEVASTFNEELLMQAMLKECKSNEEKIFLINEKIEDIRGTFFRQTMFAEFELLIHTLVEEGTPLTPGLLKEKYRQLNCEYFGKDVVVDQESDIEWARIPHFYYNYYVYQYATGISAAFALLEKVSSGDTTALTRYLEFLKSGSIDYPINLLKKAGVDMTTEEPVLATLRKFDSLVTQLETLLTSQISTQKS